MESAINYQEYFAKGDLTDAYNYFGAHVQENGVFFRIWGGKAREISVVGDFNSWDNKINPMNYGENGIWELFIEGLRPGELYKYAILGKDGKWTNKADPFAFYSEYRPGTASIIYDIQKLMKKKSFHLKNHFDQPLNTYEIHLGSWKRKKKGEFMNYRDIAPLLAEHLIEHGYNCVEVMPVMEHPLDASWGYQTTGFFSPTSRYGTPEDFRFFTEYLHKHGIAVILDWSPGHFCQDEHGLREFDGGKLYESTAHPEWGTLNFDFSKGEVRSFLISNALYWMEIFAVDGLRVDAVSSMLYLDYGIKNNSWRRNLYGGNENLDAIDFIKNLNKTVFAKYPDALMVAEESTAWPLVTYPVHEGGLGFSYKWNMGWMNDTLKYGEMEPYFKGFNHGLINFSMIYAFTENFILPFSHDEVVHGKKSLINKMPGYYEDKFANLRSLMTYMICHPGKKLTFMGTEIAPFTEWNENIELEWFLLEFPIHKEFNEYVKKINKLYLKEEALWKKDKSWDGFQWIDSENHIQKVISFVRVGENSKLLVVINFSEFSYQGFWLGVPDEGSYTLLINSDLKEFGGKDFKVKKTAKSKEKEIHGCKQGININIPAFSALIYKIRM
jgi:1,4-alpha-glucan branching enzyme